MKTTGQSEEVRATLAQEEQNSDAGEEQVASTPDEQPEQITTEEESSSPASEVAEADNTEAAEVSEEDASPRKKRKKKAEQVDVQQISPRPSYWPIALAFSLIVMFLGLAYNPIILGIGVLMIITSVIGWGLERR